MKVVREKSVTVEGYDVNLIGFIEPAFLRAFVTMHHLPNTPKLTKDVHFKGDEQSIAICVDSFNSDRALRIVAFLEDQIWFATKLNRALQGRLEDKTSWRLT